ncbi:hypothetical protein B0H34DRAFT_533628 [Crassisporium funariophilum]|nr:hypothetical protein B0H34DRAFT_533628 [Crassisporium funariophilum]
MESTNPRPAKPNDASSKNDPDPSNRSSTPTPPTASTALHHPSLPAKPPPTVPRQTPMYNIAAPQPRPPIRAITTLPELPFLPPTQNQTHLLDFTSRNSSSPNPMVGSSSQQRSGKSSKFIGVKMKPKEKAAGN